MGSINLNAVRPDDVSLEIWAASRAEVAMLATGAGIIAVAAAQEAAGEGNVVPDAAEALQADAPHA